MKRVFFAVAALILIPLMIFMGQAYLRHVTDDLAATLDRAQQYAAQKKTDQAEGEIRLFTKKWESGKSVMETFVRHLELDDINQGSARLLPYLSDTDSAPFNAECDELKIQLHHILESEQFSLSNIL